ncbi:ribonuclease HII [Gynuella sp.]|uniref:ribonuclease HII n=2 Tax=Gynuella sp. TaxID=2969146 RepID=UPI003D0C28F2
MTMKNEYENLELSLCPGLRFCGVDEVGRGPLAGDVVTAAVVLPDGYFCPELTDSKKLSERKREQLFEMILTDAEDYCIARCSVEEIDQYNIFQATMMAMVRAVRGLKKIPEFALIDGNKIPSSLPCDAKAIVKGDGRVQAISAASILAKVTRDRELVELDQQYPEYGFARHKGYPTKEHLTALSRYGITPVHRTSYAPVQAAIKQAPSLQIQESLL